MRRPLPKRLRPKRPSRHSEHGKDDTAGMLARVQNEETDHGPREGRRGTERSCALTRTVRPTGELIRFVAKGGTLTPGRSEPGRGVYTCRRLACFERAAGHRAFARVLRRPVRIEPALAHLYTADVAERAHG